MDWTTRYNVKWNKSDMGARDLGILSHMWNHHLLLCSLEESSSHIHVKIIYFPRQYQFNRTLKSHRESGLLFPSSPPPSLLPPPYSLSTSILPYFLPFLALPALLYPSFLILLSFNPSFISYSLPPSFPPSLSSILSLFPFLIPSWETYL